MIKLRKSAERGFTNLGWLQSYHSFSFADYFDRQHINFGNLRVINEDFIAPENGFGMHPHRDMEIITYVISGKLSHKDSMGNYGEINNGEVQVMTAGSGVFHSEFNNLKNSATHLLQIWVLPKQKNLEPRYDQKSFAEEITKTEGLTLLVSGSGHDNSLTINQDTKIFAAKFSAGKSYTYQITKNHKIWLQLISGKILINNYWNLEKGDAVSLEEEGLLKIMVETDCEFLLFDL